MDDITQKIQTLLNDEESMRQIQELAAMFSGGGDGSGGNNAAAENPLGADFNPAAIMQMMGAMSVQDKNCDLLLALREHLSPEKQKKIDKAVRLMKLYNVFTAMKESGMLENLEKSL